MNAVPSRCSSPVAGRRKGGRTREGPGLQALVADESGQGLVEYGLIIGLVAIALVGVLGTLTGALQAVFNNIS
jgi:pilus assembly protein Flp/PilA